VKAHASDVNVLSWNSLATFMMASGSDDHALKVWDLRTFGADAAANEHSFVANFTYHRWVHSRSPGRPCHLGTSV
jgi:ribosome assembly protein RRB1